MYPASFEYLAPNQISEAVELLRQYRDDAKLLAGGQSLVPLMKLRVARPRVLIDLRRIADLSYIREEAGQIRCGAMTRHAQIDESSVIRQKIPILNEAAGLIGDAQVRNRGTLGGALAEADPSGDYGPVVLALEAKIKCVGPKGERTIPAGEFFTFAYTSALESDELVTEVIFPLPDKSSAGIYLKLERVAGAFAIASAAVQLTLDRNGACSHVGIGVTGAGAVPRRAVSVEALLRGNKMTAQIIDKAGQLIEEEAEPIEDMRGSAFYKKKAVSAILRRALQAALKRAEARKPFPAAPA